MGELNEKIVIWWGHLTLSIGLSTVWLRIVLLLTEIWNRQFWNVYFLGRKKQRAQLFANRSSREPNDSTRVLKADFTFYCDEQQ